MSGKMWEINGNNMNNPYLDLFGRVSPLNFIQQGEASSGVDIVVAIRRALEVS